MPYTELTSLQHPRRGSPGLSYLLDTPSGGQTYSVSTSTSDCKNAADTSALNIFQPILRDQTMTALIVASATTEASVSW